MKTTKVSFLTCYYFNAIFICIEACIFQAILAIYVWHVVIL